MCSLYLSQSRNFFPVCLRLSVHFSSCFCHNPLEYSLLLPSIPGPETLSCDEMHESQKEIMCRAFINNLIWVAKETKMCRELSYTADGSLSCKVKTCKSQISALKADLPVWNGDTVRGWLVDGILDHRCKNKTPKYNAPNLQKEQCSGFQDHVRMKVLII